MNWVLSLFPQDDFSLIGVIIRMPLLGAFINGVWGKRLGKDAVRLMALSAIAISFIAALLTVSALYSAATATEAAHGGHAEHVKLSWLAWQWMHTTGGREANVPIDLKFSIDTLSATMMLVITGVGFLIHLYASSYMAEDKAYWRFFCYLNLFIFSMLILILGDNLPVLFVGWEGVGLCSYLLIGFWYGKTPNASAGKKAFIANRIGDFGLICAMFLLVHYTGALDWGGIENGAGSLVTTAKSTRIHLWPIGGGEFVGRLAFLQPHHPITISAATAVGLALLLGCTGKSAQLPLYVWLPDAMAGPTPVSALIHAATMVTAGIYLVCRMSFVFVLSPFVMVLIACIGAATALFAATIALVQNDIKKVLAYSTVSQLGFMFMGVGVGAFTAGFFHVLTHAFFKACLFLGAGSVIHAMHKRIHDDEKSQDMRFMGGLRKHMPYTFWTFTFATLAIIGFPLTSGFFSKDEILFRAWVNHPISPYAERVATMSKGKLHLYEPPTWIGPMLYFVGLAAATLTAFYMCRLLFMTFFGEFRGWTIGRPSVLAKKEADHGHDHDDEHGDDDEEHHHEEDLTTPGYAPHESPWQMTVPLMILSALSLFAGFLNPSVFKEVLHLENLPLDKWLDPVFEDAAKGSVKIAEDAHHIEWFLTLGAFAAFAVGSYLSYWMYIQKKGEPAKQLATAAGALYKGALNKWYVDELYEATVINGTDALADTAASFDQTVVDGIIARLSSLVVAAAGTILRTVQNGVVHVYAGIMVVGIAALGFFFVVPHPDATITEKNGDYILEAAPGVGYGYRWFPDANGKPINETFTGDSKVTLHPPAGHSVTAKLEVTNAFGLTRAKLFTVERPADPSQDKSNMKLGQNP